MIWGPTWDSGHKLDLRFLSEQWQWDLVFGEFSSITHVISDHGLITMGLFGVTLHSGRRDLLNWTALAIKGIWWVQRELGAILPGLLHGSSEVLVATWSRRAAKALDWIEPLQSFFSHGSHHSLDELREMKWEMSRMWLRHNKGWS